jgi:toxin-antitoxin system PIN domain toxin
LASRALLDVNVLIALLDEAHVHHETARAWLSANIRWGWASCPITQLGCVRIMAHPAYPNSRSVSQVAKRLSSAVRTSHHEYWSADVPPLADSGIEWQALLSSRHVTDVYLLSLAVAHDGRLVTFDRHVPSAVVPNARKQHLVLLGNANER